MKSRSFGLSSSQSASTFDCDVSPGTGRFRAGRAGGSELSAGDPPQGPIASAAAFLEERPIQADIQDLYTFRRRLAPPNDGACREHETRGPEVAVYQALLVQVLQALECMGRYSSCLDGR